MWVGILVAVARACDPQPVGALVSALGDADRALSVLDAAGYDGAVDRARELVPCLTEAVPVGVAASLHRAVGLLAFGQADPLAPAAFAAARRLEPAPTFPALAVPADSPVNEAWAAVSLDAVRTRSLPAPADGWIALDGRPGSDRPLDLPVLFQRLSPEGRALETAYLRPGDPDPVYAVPVPSVLRTVRRPWALVAVSAGSGAVAAGTWGLAVHGRARYLDEDRDPVPDGELPGLRTRTNALAVGSLASVALCALSTTALAVTW